jgi:RNA polymerase sigma factor (sigma-70 family)
VLDRDELDQLDVTDNGGAHAPMLTDAPPRALEDDMASVAIPPFEHFYEQHRAEVFRLLRRRVGAQRAEDAFQETFLRALQAYRRLEHGEHLRAWVLTIAGNVAVDTLRRSRPQSELVETGAEDDRPAYEELAPLTDGLSPKERAAVVLRYGYDLSYEQIAATLGSSEQAARQAASTGVRRLRRRNP